MEPICTFCYEPCRKTPTAATVCGHLYHEMCITRWFETHATCPECRNPNPGPLRTVQFEFVGPAEEEALLYEDPEQDDLLSANALVRAKFDFLIERCIELRSTVEANKRLKTSKQRKKPSNATERLTENSLGKRKSADTRHDGGAAGSARKRMSVGAQGRRYGKQDTMATEKQESSEAETIPNSQD